MREHFLAVDLKAFTELQIGPVDYLLEMLLPFNQRPLSEIVSVEIEQVESDQDDLGRSSLELVLQDRKVGRAVDGRHDDLAVDDGRAGADVPGIVGDLS